MLDTQLADPDELSDLLNKALAVLPRLREKGFTESETMREAWLEFRQSTDPVAVWLEKNTIAELGTVVPKAKLHEEYQRLYDQEGRPFLTAIAFGKSLKRARPDIQEAQRTIGAHVTHVWCGIGLKRAVR